MSVLRPVACRTRPKSPPKSPAPAGPNDLRATLGHDLGGLSLGCALIGDALSLLVGSRIEDYQFVRLLTRSLVDCDQLAHAGSPLFLSIESSGS